MSDKSITYCYGVTGFVELHDKIVKKHSEFNQLFWLKEHAILFYLWPFKTDNIIKYQSSYIRLKYTPPKNIIKKQYYECILPRYPVVLNNYKFYRDSEIIQFLLDVSSALEFLHSKNIMHRDIKPQNIVLTDTGRAILIDFSHSHHMVIPLKQLNHSVVTYLYRAPEVYEYIDNGKILYNQSVDIWSLGVILSELITGKQFAFKFFPNFKDHHHLEILLSSVLQNPEVFINKLKHFYINYRRAFALSDCYWNLIVKMLQFDPAKRITAAELYKEVEQLAMLYNIDFVKPINGPIETQLIDLVIEPPKITDKSCIKELKSKCLEYLKSIILEFKLCSVAENYNHMLEYLIQQGEITIDNYGIFVSAVTIIFETIFYDNVTDIENYTFLHNAQVKTAICHIMVKYDHYLFGYNKKITF